MEVRRRGSYIIIVNFSKYVRSTNRSAVEAAVIRIIHICRLQAYVAVLIPGNDGVGINGVKGVIMYSA